MFRDKKHAAGRLEEQSRKREKSDGVAEHDRWTSARRRQAGAVETVQQRGANTCILGKRNLSNSALVTQVPSGDPAAAGCGDKRPVQTLSH